MAPRARKVAVLGFRAVGKSSLTIQFVEGHFQDNYYPTIENTFTKQLRVNGQDYNLEIIDTAGQDEYSMFNQKHSIGIHGYILVYSITSRNSLDMLTIIKDKILNYTGTDWVPIVLVGNKCDLESQRQVRKEDVEKLTKEWNCVAVDSSARLNLNINESFEAMIGEIEKNRDQALGPISSPQNGTTPKPVNSEPKPQRRQRPKETAGEDKGGCTIF
jgi:Ras family protein